MVLKGLTRSFELEKGAFFRHTVELVILSSLGYRYVQNIMAHLQVLNLIDCAYQCTSTACCMAFNYRQMTLLSTNPWNCEIIGERSDSDLELLERNSEYSFYKAIEVTLSLNSNFFVSRVTRTTIRGCFL